MSNDPTTTPVAEGDTQAPTATPADTVEKPRIEYTPEQQAHLQGLIDAAVARAKKSTLAEVEELRTKASKFDELEEAQKTELQRAQEAAERYKSELDAAHNAIKEAELRQQVFDAAVAANAVNAGQVFALIKPDLGEGADVAAAVSAFLDSNPHFVKQTSPQRVPVAQAPGLGAKAPEAGILSISELSKLTADDYVKSPELLARAKASREWHAKNG